MDPDRTPVLVVGDVPLLRRLHEVPSIDVVWSAAELGIDGDPPSAEVAIIDLSLPTETAVEAVRAAAVWWPHMRILAVRWADTPSDTIVRALDSGATGLLDAELPAVQAGTAIAAVARGETWLPANEALELLRDVAPELESTAAERTGQLWSIVFAVVPIVGGIAAFLSFVGRKYWGQIGVRPVDIAVDPGTRVVDVLLALSMLVGVFGPLVLITGWLDAWSERINRSPGTRQTLDRMQGFSLIGVPVGRAVFSRALAWWSLALPMLGLTIALAYNVPLFVVLVVGPAIGISLLARALDLDRDLPTWLRSDRVRRSSLLAGAAAVAFAAMVFVGSQALNSEPDLRSDGLHGFVATEVLGFSAQPVLATNVDGSRPPTQVLYLGGNADLYVLYDPCNDMVEYVSVGSTHIRVIDEVVCG